MLERILYDLMYRFGSPHWDTSLTSPEVVAVIEGDTAISPGRALDLACGTGTNVIYLSRHGWEAVGVDFSPVAIAQARKRAGGTPGAAFVEGDVSRLAPLCLDGPFDFVLDIGCYHGLPAYARQGRSSCSGRVPVSAGHFFPVRLLCRTRKALGASAGRSYQSRCA
jgi:SAM-dependent methyltransferase